MKISCWQVASVLLSALVVVGGCGGGDGEVVIPNKPPLSAEVAKERAKQQQLKTIEALKERAKENAAE